jgi:cobalt-zinc-cadmium efflux system protein
VAHGHGHADGAASTRAGARHLGRLRLAFGLTLGLAVVQGLAALLLRSLAVASDTGHVLTDAIGIGMALAAVSVASHAGHGGQRTFGLYRLEILAALANAVLLLGVAAFVLAAAARRGTEAPDVHAIGLLVAGLFGLSVNAAAFAVLHEGARESVNVRGAQLEVLADLVGSVGVVVAAAVVGISGWSQIDTVIGVAIALFIVPRALRLAAVSLRILVQAAPPHLEVARIRSSLAAIPTVVDVHDLHVWTLTSDMEVVSAHLTVALGADMHAVLDRARTVLRAEHSVAHATLQVEPEDHEGCEELDW